jgi:hypothetical protein
MRKGDWIQTFSGGQFWPLDPIADEIHLIDIAAALGKECRYGGHCLRFYSVAEHSVLMYRAARMLVAPAVPGSSIGEPRARCCFHDASEAYLIDDIRGRLRGCLTGYTRPSRMF